MSLDSPTELFDWIVCSESIVSHTRENGDGSEHPMTSTPVDDRARAGVRMIA